MIVTVHGNRRQRRKAFKSRAFVNDVEVTHRCYYADTRVGEARCYAQREGKLYVESERPWTVARETLRGRVRVETNR